MRRWSTGAASLGGCGWAPRSPCRWASPWAPAPRCGASTTTAAAGRTKSSTARSRLDRIRTFSLSVLNRAFTLYGFSPQLALINEARLTNAQLQDYDRNRAELRFVRQF